MTIYLLCSGHSRSLLSLDNARHMKLYPSGKERKIDLGKRKAIKGFAAIGV